MQTDTPALVIINPIIYQEILANSEPAIQPVAAWMRDGRFARQALLNVCQHIFSTDYLPQFGMASDVVRELPEVEAPYSSPFTRLFRFRARCGPLYRGLCQRVQSIEARWHRFTKRRVQRRLSDTAADSPANHLNSDEKVVNENVSWMAVAHTVLKNALTAIFSLVPLALGTTADHLVRRFRPGGSLQRHQRLNETRTGMEYRASQRGR